MSSLVSECAIEENMENLGSYGSPHKVVDIVIVNHRSSMLSM